MKKKIIEICIMALVITIMLTPISVLAQVGCFKTDYNVRISYDKSNIVDIQNTNFRYDDVLDQQQVDYTGYGWTVWGSNVALAQSFKPTLNHQTKVELLLWKVGVPTSLKVSIRSDLSGSDLTFVVIPSSEIYTTTSWKEFNFPDADVNPGLTYYIVWEPLGTSTGNTFYWGFGNNNPYTNGNSWVFINSQWSLLEPQEWPGFDFCFKTYGLTNQPPNPPTITGETTGDIQTSYDYTIQTTDPDHDDMEYFVDWGDGTNESFAIYESGAIITVSHKWSTKGSYIIKVKAIDVHYAESDWATLTVTMPCSYNKPIPQIFKLLFQRLPNAFPLLQQLLRY